MDEESEQVCRVEVRHGTDLGNDDGNGNVSLGRREV